MTELIEMEDLPEFDISEFLDSPETIAAYFNDILAEGNPALLGAALGDVARARSMTEIARKAGMSRESLYKALRPDSAPRFETISKVCQALGLRLSVVPIQEKVPDAAFFHDEDRTPGEASPPFSIGTVESGSGRTLGGTDYGPAGDVSIIKHSPAAATEVSPAYAGSVAKAGKASNVQTGVTGQPVGGNFGIWHYGMPRSGDIQKGS